MRNVTIKQLRAFVTLAHHRSFTRAATQLGISQSALTLQIRDLEAEVGLRLFDRSPRSVELTRQATEVLPMITRALDQIEEVIETLQAQARHERGRVAVTAGASVISVIIAPAIARMARTHPGIAVRIIEESGDDIARRVLDGDADIGIAALTRSYDSLDAQVVLKDRMGVLCTGQHALARKGSRLRWSDLAGLSYATFRPGTPTRHMLDTHAVIGPSIPRPAYEVSSVSALLSLAEQGATIAVLPWISAYPAIRRNVSFRPLGEPDMFRELHLIKQRRRSLAPSAQALASAILDEITRLGKAPRTGLAVTMTGNIARLRERLS